jgi:alpha-L-fucosidase 2
VEVLPALPKAWPKGSVTGLCARGGFDVDVTWDAGKLTKITLHSKLGNPCTLRYGDKTILAKIQAGKTYTFDGELRPLPS